MNNKAGAKTPRLETTVNTGQRCPSKASWYSTREVFATVVALLTRQQAAIKTVTKNEADSPQNGLVDATRLRYKLPSLPVPAGSASCIITQEQPRNTTGINQAAAPRNPAV